MGNRMIGFMLAGGFIVLAVSVYFFVFDGDDSLVLSEGRAQARDFSVSSAGPLHDGPLHDGPTSGSNTPDRTDLVTPMSQVARDEIVTLLPEDPSPFITGPEDLFADPKVGIEARVVDQEGVPREGVTIDVYRGRPDAFFEMRKKTDGAHGENGSDGRFRILDLRPFDVYAIVITHEDSIAVDPLVVETQDSVLDLGDIELVMGGSIEGRLYRPDGEPVEGAQVFADLLVDPNQDDYATLMVQLKNRSRWTFTKGDGSYRLGGLKEAQYRARAFSNAYNESLSPYVSVRRGHSVADVDLYFQPGRPLVGKVIGKDGVTISGAEITLHQVLEKIPRLTSQSDTQGSFAFPSVGFRESTLTVSAEGYATKEVPGIVPQAEPIILQLEPYGSISGEVVDAMTSESLSPFEISVHRSAGKGEWSPVDRSQLSLGKFVFDGNKFDANALDPGIYRVHVEAEGYASHESSEIAVQGGEAGESILIRLFPECVIHGRVIDAIEKLPISRAKIRVRQRRLESDSAPTATRVSRTIVSEVDGGFAVRGLSSGEFEMEVNAHGYAPRLIGPLLLSPTSEGEETVVELSRGGTLWGTVKDGDGELVGGVAIKALGPKEREGSYTVRTDSQGVYRVSELPMGNYRVLRLSVDRLRSRNFSVEEPGDNPIEEAEVFVVDGEAVECHFESAALASVKGVVMGASGAVRGAMVMVHETDESMGKKYRDFVADEQGRYRILELLPRTYRFEVLAPGGAIPFEKQVTLTRGEQELNFQLPSASISGRALFKGGPVENVRVTLHSATDEFRERSRVNLSGELFLTGQDGRFEIQYVPKGLYELSLSHSTLVLEEPYSLEVKERPLDSISLSLVEGGRVQGSLSDLRTGAPVAGIMVFLMSGERVIQQRHVYSSNEFEFVGLLPREYEIQVGPGGGFEETSKTFELKTGQTVKFKFELSPKQ